MAVITISRQFGSGGDEIAEKVAQALNYRLFNKEMIEQAARDEGITSEDVLDVADDTRVRSFLDRLLESFPPLELYQSGAVLPAVLTEEHAILLFQKAVKTACDTGNVVIVGRGGQAMLQDHPDALHVRIEAPLEVRLERVQKEFKLDRRRAIDRVESRDRASADYIQRHYGADWADPRLYHLVLNTGKLGKETAIHLVIEAARLILPAIATS